MERHACTVLAIFALLLAGADKKPEPSRPNNSKVTEALESLGAHVVTQRGDIISVCLSDSKKPADDALKHLVGLSSLRALSLDNIPITNAGFEHLARLNGLEMLAIRRQN